MKWPSRDVLLCFLGLSAAAGVGAAGVSVYRALTAVRVLIAVEDLGTTAVSEILYEAQESRHATLEVLASRKRPERLTRSTRVTDARIAGHLKELTALGTSGALQANVATLRNNWRAFAEIRDRVASLALEGNFAKARTLEAGDFTVAFEHVAASSRTLQHTLGDFSAEQEETVHTGLKRGVAELSALATTTILFVGTLIWSRHKQQKLLSLQNKTEQIERDRRRILEMAGRNEPLLTILQALVSLTQKQLPGSAACVFVVQDGYLRDVVASALPKELLASAYPRGALATGIDLSTRKNKAAAHGMAICWSQDVVSSTGNLIGCLDVYLKDFMPIREAQTALLEGVANLAGIVIQNREMYEQLAFQATRDPLTDLPNRRLFQDRLEQAILRARREKEKLAVLLIDLDRFKQTNDLLGHRVGDLLLREVAQRASGSLRKSDTISRIGGDEFTVLLNPVNGEEGAEQALKRIVEALKPPLEILGHKITVSASIGLSIYPDHGEDPATLVRNADLAMYDAKANGKNGWQKYVPELGAVVLRRMSIEKAFETALENQEFELHYQAQTRPDRFLAGAEALVRWHNPDLGQVSPGKFIPVAEESGFINPLGAWVLEQACRQTASWIKAGMLISRVAVNVSARQLGDAGFIDVVCSALKLSGLSPDRLELELTETALMSNVENCMQRLLCLRELGISMAIDDFGTGYSSLFYLQKLPVSRLKIDQSFVRGITRDSHETLPLIRAIVDLAHGLDLKVVAEGVETETQAEALTALRCDFLQGYLIHKPQPTKQAENAFRQLLPDLVWPGSSRDIARRYTTVQ